MTIKLDTAFDDVMRACAAPRADHPETWINDEIIRFIPHFMARACAFDRGVGWQELVGGLYGVSLGSAFFGESMFSRMTDASKIALVHLVALAAALRLYVCSTRNSRPSISRDSARMKSPARIIIICWRRR